MISQSDMSSNNVRLTDGLTARVIKQIEYYFSDINLRNDRFVRQIMEKNNGWLSFDCLMKFNRLNQMVNNDRNLLREIVGNCRSEVIELDSSADKIRRKANKPIPELDEQTKQSLDERTVHLKGFPDGTTLADVIEWAERLGTTLTVQRGRPKTCKQMDGCAYVTFAEKSVTDRVMSFPVLTFRDKPIVKERKLQKDERKRQKKNQNLLNLDKKFDDMSVEDTVQDLESDENVIKVQSAVIEIKGLPQSMVSKEKEKKSDKIRQQMSSYGKVVHIGTNGSANCLVEFDSGSAVKKLMDTTQKTDSTDGKEIHKMVIEGHDVTVELLTGAEEMKYWKVVNKKTEQSAKKKTEKKLKKTEDSPSRKRSPSSVSNPEPKRMEQDMA